MESLSAQTKKNWAQNKENPRRAVQQTPLIRNLRSRQIVQGEGETWFLMLLYRSKIYLTFSSNLKY